MRQSIHVQTARVVGHNPDSSSIIERSVVKYEAGRSFNNFLKHVNLKGFMTSEPPKVIKVLEIDGNKQKSVSLEPYKAQVEEALKPAENKGKVDYKSLSEAQAEEIKGLKTQHMSIMDRLESLEKGNDPDPLDIAPTTEEVLKEKAKNLGISFPANIGDDKLLGKILEKDPDFKI